jgi:hypothetical protein
MLGYGLKYGSGFAHTHLGILEAFDKKDEKKSAST